MTEAQFLAIPMEQRRAMPFEKLLDAVLRTHEDMHETLSIEGFEFVGYDESEADSVAGIDRPEVWKREIGGQIEWVEVWKHGSPTEAEPERAWLRNPSPCDPRTITD